MKGAYTECSGCKKVFRKKSAVNRRCPACSKTWKSPYKRKNNRKFDIYLPVPEQMMLRVLREEFEMVSDSKVIDFALRLLYGVWKRGAVQSKHIEKLKSVQRTKEDTKWPPRRKGK